MQINYHIGANCTDHDRLLKSLLKNSDPLSKLGAKVPGPGKYRNLIREAIQGIGKDGPAADTRDVLLDAILDGDDAERLVLSYDRFICFPKRVFENSLLYHLIDEKVMGMRQIFPNDELRYFMALRNPATFIPAVFADQEGKSYEEFMRFMEPQDMKWSLALERLRRADPNAHLTVWCDEDTPLIWAQLIRTIAGVDPMTRISGGFDLLQHILTEEGMQGFVKHLRDTPPRTEAEKRGIIQDYIQRHAKPGALDQEINLPDWDQSLVDDLTRTYLEDVEKIKGMEGVTFIAP